MVGPEDVDEERQRDIEEECAKYGKVVQVIIYQVIFPCPSPLSPPPLPSPPPPPLSLMQSFQRVSCFPIVNC